MWQYISGAFLGWSLGSNDAANVFGTGVATNLVRYRTAVILIAVFVILGAVLEGPKCILTLGGLSRVGSRLAFICTLAAGAVMFAMSRLGLPSSSSQAIVGAVFAAGLANGSADLSIFSKMVLCWILTPIGAALISVILYHVLGRIARPLLAHPVQRTRILKSAILAAGCYGSYALGTNNVANVSGIYVGSGQMSAGTASLFGGICIAAGVLTYGRRVMMTVGKGIFPLDAFTALIAVISQAVTTHIFTQIGVPVSGSQAIVGAVIGIGLVKNLSALSGRKVTEILLGWVMTPVVSAAVCAGLMRLIG